MAAAGGVRNFLDLSSRYNDNGCVHVSHGILMRGGIPCHLRQKVRATIAEEESGSLIGSALLVQHVVAERVFHKIRAIFHKIRATPRLKQQKKVGRPHTQADRGTCPGMVISVTQSSKTEFADWLGVIGTTRRRGTCFS